MAGTALTHRAAQSVWHYSDSHEGTLEQLACILTAMRSDSIRQDYHTATGQARIRGLHAMHMRDVPWQYPDSLCTRMFYAVDLVPAVKTALVIPFFSSKACSAHIAGSRAHKPAGQPPAASQVYLDTSETTSPHGLRLDAVGVQHRGAARGGVADVAAAGGHGDVVVAVAGVQAGHVAGGRGVVGAGVVHGTCMERLNYVRTRAVAMKEYYD